MIDKLVLRNFRSYQDATLEPRQINLITGLNGTGKTTIVDAIAMCLTGTCQGAAGRDLGALRRVGSNRRWHLALHLAGGTILERNEGEGPRAAAQEAVRQAIGSSPDQILACLYSGRLVDLAARERSELIRALAPPADVELPARARELLQACGWAPASSVPRAGLLALYERAYQARRDAGAEAKGAAPVAPAAPEGLEGMDSAQLEAARGKLAARVEELDAQHRAASRQAADAQQMALRRMQEKQRAEELRAELAGATPPPAPEGDPELAQRVEGLAAARKKYVKQLEQLQEAQASARAALRSIEERIAAAGGADDGTCPTCGRALPKGASRKARAAAEADKALGERALEAANEDVRRLRDTMHTNQAALEACRQQLQAAESHAIKVAAWEQDQARKREELEHLERSLASPLPEAPEVRLDQLEARVRAGRSKLLAVAAYLGALNAYEAALARAEGALARHRQLDELVKLLDDLQRTSTGGQLEAFAGEIVAACGSFGLAVDLAPLLADGSDPLVNGVPLRHLSRGQQLEFGLAFQVAAAHRVRLGFVCVDNLDALDPIQYRAVLCVLAGAGLQVFAFRVLAQDVEEWRPKAAAENARGKVLVVLVQRDDSGASSLEAP